MMVLYIREYEDKLFIVWATHKAERVVRLARLCPYCEAEA